MLGFHKQGQALEDLVSGEESIFMEGRMGGIWCGIVQDGGVMLLQSELIEYVAMSK